jgi:ribonuclease HI
MKRLDTITIHTDGACKGNPGPGGWGAVIEVGNERLFIGGREDFTTNHRMELRAAVEALNQIGKPGREVRLVTDSQYVQKGMSEWLRDWKARNWKNAAKKPVKNADLWRELDELANKHSVEWAWVRSHSGDSGNDMADTLANRALKKGAIHEIHLL